MEVYTYGLQKLLIFVVLLQEARAMVLANASSPLPISNFLGFVPSGDSVVVYRCYG